MTGIPVVNIQQLAFNINIGQDITLECSIKANPIHTAVYWQRIVNGQTTQISTTNSNKYSGSTVNTPSLTVSDVIKVIVAHVNVGLTMLLVPEKANWLLSVLLKVSKNK